MLHIHILWRLADSVGPFTTGAEISRFSHKGKVGALRTMAERSDLQSNGLSRLALSLRLNSDMVTRPGHQSPKGKPVDYDFDLAKAIVNKMAAKRMSLSAVCSSSTLFPSYDTARKWLVDHEEFRAIYPRKGATWFRNMSEARIRKLRKPLEDAWRAHLLS